MSRTTCSSTSLALQTRRLLAAMVVVDAALQDLQHQGFLIYDPGHPKSEAFYGE